MTINKPLILVTNDDGVYAQGLHHLIDCLKDYGQIITVAPDRSRSGQSSAITTETPLRLTRQHLCGDTEIYSLNGTPTDCVKLAMHAVMPSRPDLILSGINHGSNSGNSTIYSGTMGAAMEGCMAGIPSIGFSLLHHSINADFSNTTRLVQKIVKAVLAKGLPEQICLNVNIPAKCKPEGIKVCQASPGHWTEEFADYTDPAGRKFYLLTGKYIDSDPENPLYDNYWLSRKYVTVVPVKPDQTHTGSISCIQNIIS